MPNEIGVRALRDGLTRHLARVRRGARLLITDRGRPIAVLAPYEEGERGESSARLAAVLSSAHVTPAVRPFRPDPPLVRGRGKPASEILSRGSALIYADSSVVVKRYYEERGSDLLKSRWVTIDRIFTSRVAYAEIHAALARKARDGELSRDSFRTCTLAFEQEWPAYDHILVDEATLKDVRSLVRPSPAQGIRRDPPQRRVRRSE